MLSLRHRTSAPSAQTFRYPLKSPTRIAVFSKAFATADNLIAFDTVDVSKFTSHGIETVAAPFDILQTLASTAWRPVMPIVIFTGPQLVPLGLEGRNQLWAMFGMPLFEQLLSANGTLTASECAAHQSLHLEPGIDLHSREWAATIGRRRLALANKASLCGCGSSSPHITLSDYLDPVLLAC
jgi:hypothetical protein